MEKNLKTNRATGLNADETTINGTIAFEDITPKGTLKYGVNDDTVPVPKKGNPTTLLPPTKYPANAPFADRRYIFSVNKLPKKKSKTFLELT